MGDFLFADRNHPVPEVLPNNGRVDAFTPDYFVEHSLFVRPVKCTDSRQRFDGGAIIGNRVSTPVTEAMAKLASHGFNPLGMYRHCTAGAFWWEGMQQPRGLFFNTRPPLMITHVSSRW